jgi:hypothetical protein
MWALCEHLLCMMMIPLSKNSNGPSMCCCADGLDSHSVRSPLLCTAHTTKLVLLLVLLALVLLVLVLVLVLVLLVCLTLSALRLSLWKSSPPHVRSMRAPTMPAFSMASSTSTLWLEGPSAHTSLVPAQPQQQQHNQQATPEVTHVVTKGRCQLHRVLHSMVLPQSSHLSERALNCRNSYRSTMH